MIQQVILNKKDYDEIERIIAEHNEMKKVLVEYDAIQKQLIDFQNINAQFEEFKELVANMFLDEDGNFEYQERPIARNTLFLNDEIIAELFNYFYKEKFFKETKLEVDPYWNFKG